MSRTLRYRQQHAELAALVVELERQLDAATLSADPTKARTLLSTLAGKLSVHLATEDGHLYPELARSSNENLKRMAVKFAQEMGPIAQTFTAYTRKWPTPSAIKADPSGFIAQTQSVMKVLKDRIKRENQEFYALADTV